jgi:hypothetical protein
MDIYSLHKQVKFDADQNLYNLFQPTFAYNTSVELQEYEVTRDDEMRDDMIFMNIYQYDISMLQYYLDNIDVLLFINNIDNPLNIKAGMIIRYPSPDDFDRFRYTDTLESLSTDVTKQLATPNLPNKATKVDPNRQSYLENDYSLPPVVLDVPREPVRIQDGRFSIGGL